MSKKERYIAGKQAPMEIYAIANGTTSATNLTTQIIDLSGKTLLLGNLGIQVIGKGVNASDATFTLQHSMDKLTWDTVSGGMFTLASGSSTQTQFFTNISFSYYRVVYNKGSNTVGTIQVTLKFS